MESFFIIVFVWLRSVIFNPINGFEHFDKARKNLIRNWLDKHYGYLIPERLIVNKDSQEQSSDIIWVFWYQGLESMPEVVRLCYNSICENSNQKNVILITKENINEYVKLSPSIFEKVEKGLISYTHLSDILRVNLLYDHGGLWMDCTLFVSAPIETSDYNSLFYSIKSEPLVSETISDYRWTTFFLYADKNSPVFYVLRELFDVYVSENNLFIDYFLIDYFLDMLYRNNAEFKQCVDSIMPLSPKVHLFITELNELCSETKLEDDFSDSSIFKLNYRNYFVKQVDNSLTLYGYLVNKYL